MPNFAEVVNGLIQKMWNLVLNIKFIIQRKGFILDTRVSHLLAPS